MLQFGIPTLIENRTLEDNIALCKELGLSFVELNMNFPEYQIDKMENIDWFYKKADDAGIYYTIHFRVHHQLQGLAQTHVHRISDAIQPS